MQNYSGADILLLLEAWSLYLAACFPSIARSTSIRSILRQAALSPPPLVLQYSWHWFLHPASVVISNNRTMRKKFIVLLAVLELRMWPKQHTAVQNFGLEDGVPFTGYWRAVQAQKELLSVLRQRIASMLQVRPSRSHLPLRHYMLDKIMCLFV